MNPAYAQARLRAELPQGALPESFAVITACNPNGETQADHLNKKANDELRLQFDKLGYDHFPVTGYDTSSPHEEPGFGVVCPEATASRIGSTLGQQAIFHIHRGQISLIACGHNSDRSPLGPWSSRVDPPADKPRFHIRGPVSLLASPATAFLCSTKCPAEKVEEAYEWARKQCDLGSTIISGFHTPVEKDVLAILARRGARIIWVTARELPKTNQKEFRPTVEQGRLLIISPFDYGTRSRATKDSCSERNRFVVNYATEQYVPYLSPDSAINVDLQGL